ncbi:hypothetical protein PC120_g23203, partial [Phytophthora cactorum]
GSATGNSSLDATSPSAHAPKNQIVCATERWQLYSAVVGLQELHNLGSQDLSEEDTLPTCTFQTGAWERWRSSCDVQGVVDWLIEYGRDWDFNWKAYVRFDCSEGMLKHLEEKRKSYPTTCPIVEAVATRRLDEVERLHCDASAYKIKVAMAEAARHNQVEVVKYLIKRYKTYNTRLAVETADAVAKLKYGRMDILKSFENDSDYETDEDYEDRRYERMEGRYRASDVLGEAARAGHREAVRWILDAARVESKTIHVIERAVRDGRHDVVVLLCSCCTKEERYLTLYRGISLRSTLDAIKAILRRVLTRKTGRYCGNTATKIQAPRRGDSQVST